MAKIKAEDRNALLATPLLALLGYGFAWAGSDGAVYADGHLSPFALAVLIAFVIQWVAFLPSYFRQTEKYFDLVGSITYISVTLIAFLAVEQKGPRATLLLVLVLLWAGRLGSFLFKRIHKSGKDGRFDDLKKSFLRFGGAWTLQGFWVVFTAAAALAAIGSPRRPDFDIFAIVGLIIWLVGFSIEAVADWQKSKFKADESNEGDFISSGLWAKSRHPNYFGEIVLWLGVAIIAFPALEGWQLLTLLSPAFVALLLCKVSGIPLLEERADKRWGGQEDYERYKRNTPVLIPRP